MFYKISVLNILQYSQENICAGVSVISCYKETPHKCFLLNFATISRIPFLQNTQTTAFDIYCNSLIKKNLSNVSTIGCLICFGNFVGKHLHWVYFSHWGCSLFLSTWNLKISERYCKYFQMNHIRTSCIFY